MSSELVHCEQKGTVTVIRIDDGKVNALSHDVLDQLCAAFDHADTVAAGAVALVGREGKFSAGFDLSVMNQGIEAATELLSKGAQLALRIYDSPRPVVFGVTGHALAMGAVLLMTPDERIGAEGTYKIGLNEVAIGMTLPEFALILADERLSRRHLYRATSQAEIYSPQDAVDVGYLDTIVPADRCAETAIARAGELAATLHAKAHRNTKHALRRDTVDKLKTSLGASIV